MRLSADVALERLTDHDHGALCTVHPERGVDAVPVVYALANGHVGVPIDRVKPKSSSQLQRERNLGADPRATLLVDHWDRDDWSQLWWVRAELRLAADEPADESVTAALVDRLVERYAQYDHDSFDRVLVLGVVGVSGWSAG